MLNLVGLPGRLGKQQLAGHDPRAPVLEVGEEFAEQKVAELVQLEVGMLTAVTVGGGHFGHFRPNLLEHFEQAGLSGENNCWIKLTMNSSEWIAHQIKARRRLQVKGDPV